MRLAAGYLIAFIFSFLASTRAQGDQEIITWDLTPIFATPEAWKSEVAAMEKDLSAMKPCKGRLGDSASKLNQCLETYFKLQLRMGRASAWASLNNAADLKSSISNERVQLVSDLRAKLAQQTAFLSPEIAKIGRKKVEGFVAKHKPLQTYRQYLRSVLDHAEHILDPARGELLASLSPVLNAGHDIHSLMMSADIDWPVVTLSDGKKEKINTAAYTKYREARSRDDRAKAFDAYYASLSQFQRTLGANLASNVKLNATMAKVRNYKNAVTAALDDEKIPEEVYRTLVQQVNAGLPVFHKYLKYQAEALELKKLEYIDAYVSASDLDLKFSLAETRRISLEAAAPLGADYVKKFEAALSQRWMDVYPREGKANGAFMEPGAYGVHPYILLNHQDNFESASTFAHEWGHAMHTVLTEEAQPYVNSEYSIFIAEIASTVNEILLHERLIKNAKDPKKKAFYLGALLKMIRGTFFRQTQFAEFELAIHEEVERGEALTGQKISEIYGQIARKYYGHDKGAMTIDEKFFSEWVFVPHFYNSFYVYQYATSLSAAFYFAEAILSGKANAAENYLKVLRAGGSKYPYEILKDAGVDMKDPQVYQAVVRRMDRAIEELRQLPR